VHYKTIFGLVINQDEGPALRLPYYVREVNLYRALIMFQNLGICAKSTGANKRALSQTGYDIDLLDGEGEVVVSSGIF